jgi:hypothetical protein
MPLYDPPRLALFKPENGREKTERFKNGRTLKSSIAQELN